MVIYTVSLTPTGPGDGNTAGFQLSGSVDSVTVTVPERIPSHTAGSNSKPHFQGALTANGHVLTLSSNATTSCQNATDPLSAAATAIFAALPRGIAPRQSWTDTVSTVTCRGRTPIQATTVRQYTAIADTVWGGKPALLLARHDTLIVRNRPDSSAASVDDSANHGVAGAIDSASANAARDSTNAMEATGSGHADFAIYVDPRSGLLLHATGTSHTEILVTTGGSRFPFSEEAHQTITLLK
jgi:hypothetical protein